jgi:hypothetical protein
MIYGHGCEIARLKAETVSYYAVCGFRRFVTHLSLDTSLLIEYIRQYAYPRFVRDQQ